MEGGSKELTGKEIGGCAEQKTMVKAKHCIFRNKAMQCGI